jgi:CheY-like chemotaxis protein
MTTAQRPLVVLIVDDHAKMRHLLRMMLSADGARTVECSDGAQVLGAYREHQPDWVFMDIKMPQMDGLTASRLLMNHFPAARVVMLTDFDDDTFRAAAQAAGARRYVLKENLAELLTIIGPGSQPTAP